MDSWPKIEEISTAYTSFKKMVNIWPSTSAVYYRTVAIIPWSSESKSLVRMMIETSRLL
jgi:hypothetical protein